MEDGPSAPWENPRRKTNIESRVRQAPWSHLPYRIPVLPPHLQPESADHGKMGKGARLSHLRPFRRGEDFARPFFRDVNQCEESFASLLAEGALAHPLEALVSCVIRIRHPKSNGLRSIECLALLWHQITENVVQRFRS